MRGVGIKHSIAFTGTALPGISGAGWVGHYPPRPNEGWAMAWVSLHVYPLCEQTNWCIPLALTQ